MKSVPLIKSAQPILVAYFCMEFALDDEYGIYSGGLGVLAGDILHQAHDSAAQLIGIGLAYATTYKQKLAPDGQQIEENLLIDPQKNGLSKITDKNGQSLEITIPIQDRQVKIQAWSKKIGQTSIILLDTNLPENTTADQHITNQLYIGDREHRLLQEMVLGIGGVRMLNAMKLKPAVYHMNEGHSALLSLEVTQYFKKHHPDLDFNSALQQCSQKIVFTNHTLVAAGRDAFSFDLVSTYLLQYAQEIEIPIEAIIKMGKIEHSSLFSMNMMALRNACRANAVSHEHAQKAQDIWTNHPLIPITNGIYLPRWISPHKTFLLDKTDALNNDSLTTKKLWLAHQQDKAELIAYVAAQTQKTIPQNALIISWARRFVAYKRPLALFWQLDWLEQIINSSPVPIHFLFGGKLHPHNEEGKELLAQVVKLSTSDRFRNNLTFIPNYNLKSARYLVRGSDVWLNTPIEGYEACGTSGMKAALNGVLLCSTNSGWVREVDWDKTGWILDSDHISESLYSMIEKEIIPLFTDRPTDYPAEWIKRMFKSSQIVKNGYSAERMLNDYYSQLYGTE